MRKTVHIDVEFPYSLDGLTPSKKLAPSKQLKPARARTSITVYKKVNFEGGEEIEKV